MIGTKINKPIADLSAYAAAADWCNEHDHVGIVDRGEYYEVVDTTPPPPTLDELKEKKLNALGSLFNERTAGDIQTSQGYLMQFDTSDSLKMQGAITLMETTGQTEGYLTQADDTTIYHVPRAVMKTVLVEMLAAYAQCHARKQELRAQIQAAQSEEELNAVEIVWPL